MCSQSIAIVVIEYTFAMLTLTLHNGCIPAYACVKYGKRLSAVGSVFTGCDLIKSTRKASIQRQVACSIQAIWTRVQFELDVDHYWLKCIEWTCHLRISKCEGVGVVRKWMLINAINQSGIPLVIIVQLVAHSSLSWSRDPACSRFWTCVCVLSVSLSCCRPLSIWMVTYEFWSRDVCLYPWHSGCVRELIRG